MPVFTQKKFIEPKHTLPLCYIENNLIEYDENTALEHSKGDFIPKLISQVNLNIVVPQQDITQYFIQWQRYRKYWWSSITTTPSLFAINEIKNEDERAEANIVAQFPWGHHTVETISTSSETKQSSSQLKCSLILENAMFTLLLDGLNNTREEYLRLHKNMAPYKISFALKSGTSNDNDLCGLAKLMYYKLKSRDISTCIPNFTHSLEQQIRENLQLGVTYTAILHENTLTNGIFHLMSSSTMLKEEVHVADFDSYAALICKK